MSYKWKDEDLEFLRENFGILSKKEIAEKIGRTENSIQLKANRMGLTLPIKYSYDKDYFKNIDCEEKAYWLGFIYADGYISTYNNGRNNEFGIELSAIDDCHLKKFNKCIGGNIDVSYRKREHHFKNNVSNVEICSLRIYSRQFVNNLIDKGVYHNKTNILEFPKFLPKELVRHFIRGYIDGDGYISFHKRKYGNGYGYVTRWGFVCHSEKFTKDIKSYLENELSFDSKLVLYKDKNSFNIDSANQKQLLTIIEYLYKDATIYLDRKYETYKKLHHYLINRSAYRKRNHAM